MQMCEILVVLFVASFEFTHSCGKYSEFFFPPFVSSVVHNVEENLGVKLVISCYLSALSTYGPFILDAAWYLWG